MGKVMKADETVVKPRIKPDEEVDKMLADRVQSKKGKLTLKKKGVTTEMEILKPLSKAEMIEDIEKQYQGLYAKLKRNETPADPYYLTPSAIAYEVKLNSQVKDFVEAQKSTPEEVTAARITLDEKDYLKDLAAVRKARRKKADEYLATLETTPELQAKERQRFIDEQALEIPADTLGQKIKYKHVDKSQRYRHDNLFTSTPFIDKLLDPKWELPESDAIGGPAKIAAVKTFTADLDALRDSHSYLRRLAARLDPDDVEAPLKPIKETVITPEDEARIEKEIEEKYKKQREAKDKKWEEAERKLSKIKPDHKKQYTVVTVDNVKHHIYKTKEAIPVGADGQKAETDWTLEKLQERLDDKQQELEQNLRKSLEKKVAQVVEREPPPRPIPDASLEELNEKANLRRTYVRALRNYDELTESIYEGYKKLVGNVDPVDLYKVPVFDAKQAPADKLLGQKRKVPTDALPEAAVREEAMQDVGDQQKVSPVPAAPPTAVQTAQPHLTQMVDTLYAKYQPSDGKGMKAFVMAALTGQTGPYETYRQLYKDLAADRKERDLTDKEATLYVGLNLLRKITKDSQMLSIAANGSLSPTELTTKLRERLVKIMAANGIDDSVSLDIGTQTGLLLDKLKPSVNDFIATANPTVGALMTEDGKKLLHQETKRLVTKQLKAAKGDASKVAEESKLIVQGMNLVDKQNAAAVKETTKAAKKAAVGQAKPEPTLIDRLKTVPPVTFPTSALSRFTPNNLSLLHSAINQVGLPQQQGVFTPTFGMGSGNSNTGKLPSTGQAGGKGNNWSSITLPGSSFTSVQQQQQVDSGKDDMAVRLIVQNTEERLQRVKDKMEKISKNDKKNYKDSITNELADLTSGVKALPKTSNKRNELKMEIKELTTKADLLQSLKLKDKELQFQQLHNLTNEDQIAGEKYLKKTVVKLFGEAGGVLSDLVKPTFAGSNGTQTIANAKPEGASSGTHSKGSGQSVSHRMAQFRDQIIDHHPRLQQYRAAGHPINGFDRLKLAYKAVADGYRTAKYDPISGAPLNPSEVVKSIKALFSKGAMQHTHNMASKYKKLQEQIKEQQEKNRRLAVPQKLGDLLKSKANLQYKNLSQVILNAVREDNTKTLPDISGI